MDTATFYMWLDKHFIPNLPPARPVVLLVDNAGAHIDFDTFELAKRNDVFMYALLKNATHLVQPADVGLFGAMKQSWYKNVRRYSQQNRNTDITKKNFCSIFKKTWEDAMHPSILVDAFRKSGVYPINRQQISCDNVRPSIVYAGTSTISSSVEPSTALSVFGEQEAALALTFLSNPLQSTPLRAMSSSLLQQSATVYQLPVSQQTVPFIGAISSQLPQQSAAINPQPGSQVPLGATYTPLQFPVQQSGAAMRAAFVAFESALQSPVRVKYRRRVDEGYDLPGSPTYEVWRKLYTVSLTLIGNPPDVSSTPQFHETQSVSAVNFADLSPTPVFSDTRCHPPRVTTEVSAVFQEVLTYPSAPESTKTKKNKRSLPNFMNSEESLRTMRDEKLKKARDVAAKQKKLREREERKEAKRKESEDKKRKMEEKKRVKEKSSTKKTKKRKVSQCSKGKQWRQGLTLGESSCKVCLCEYDEADVENMPWVMCDECKYWMHIDCIPLGVDISSIDNGDNFFCHDCV